MIRVYVHPVSSEIFFPAKVLPQGSGRKAPLLHRDTLWTHKTTVAQRNVSPSNRSGVKSDSRFVDLIRHDKNLTTFFIGIGGELKTNSFRQLLLETSPVESWPGDSSFSRGIQIKYFTEYRRTQGLTLISLALQRPIRFAFSDWISPSVYFFTPDERPPNHNLRRNLFCLPIFSRMTASAIFRLVTDRHQSESRVD